MARHKQPREVAELKGAHKKDPQRYNGDPPKSAMALGNAPEYMSDDAKAIWFELSTYALPGVLTGADRYIMEVTATLIAEFRRNPDEFAVGKHSVLAGHLARMGLSPADRQKLTPVDKKKGNDFEGF